MEINKTIGLIRENVKKAIIGKDEIIDLMLMVLISSGHALIEDVPGLGKTTLVSALAKSLGCSFQRIQFTPDVLPSDITGFNMFDIKTGEKTFHKGSAFNQIILADEINRASPKTQSALLEAMQEKQVTVDLKTYALPAPFIVMATQNPVEMAGTYPLPEAQIDRFLMKISLGYPSKEAEKEILKMKKSPAVSSEITQVADTSDLLELQKAASEVKIDDSLMEYIISLVEATRNFDGVLSGCSPRASIALMQASCAKALIEGRNYVVPDDIKFLAPYVLTHRIILKSRFGAGGLTAQKVIEDILKTVKIPKN